MSPEAQRIAIAEACGLNRIEPLRRMTRKGKFADDGVRIVYCESHHGGASVWTDVPDYLPDLNEMHEAVNSLDEIGKRFFAANLYEVAVPEDDRFEDSFISWPQLALILSASPEQWAEAFLRSLDLWEDDA